MVEENIALTVPFTEDEIKEALFQIQGTKASGPDGLFILFYQHFWPIVKDDVVRLFRAFHEGKLQISMLNKEMVCLLPKKGTTRTIKDYRPISLLNLQADYQSADHQI
jgi:hypothetical protein